MTDDFAMCFGSKCPLRRKCRRFAESCNDRGRHAVWTVENYKDGKCELFIPLKQKQDDKETRQKPQPRC